MSNATLTVIETSHAGIDVDGLVYSYQLIKGVKPRDVAAIAFFMGWTPG